ncbi:13597_t:CDS:1, partial [Funneliformis caledonium]
TICKQIHCIRSVNIPLQPQTLQDINIPNYLYRTISRNQFL